MGQILSQPETEKTSESGADKRLAYGLSCMQGWRINMEDAHATILDLHEGKEDHSVAFFGVYDGHGGEKTAIFTGARLHGLVAQTEAFKRKDYVNALKDGFLLCDQAILQDFETRTDESGCAATSVIVTKTHVYCGNAGDSRTVLSSDGFARALSYDHKPYNEGEKARITAGGGYVDMGRVNGNLALSRGIGDFVFKKNADLPAEEQIVTCYPDVLIHKLDLAHDEFIILACDGIWDCLLSQSCVECVRRGIYERKTFTTICEEIMELCCAPTSDGLGIGCDNMSILIVALLDSDNNETLEQWYDRVIAKVDAHKEQVAAVRAENADLDDAEVQLRVPLGPIAPEYNDLYKEIFGEHYDIGQQGAGELQKSNGYSMFGNMSRKSEEDKAEEQDNDTFNSGAILLQKLLSSNVITNENGVIYLDTSSAQSLLALFGMPSGAEGDDDEDEEDNVHEKHIEEVDDAAE